jgi:hypothetical protein
MATGVQGWGVMECRDAVRGMECTGMRSGVWSAQGCGRGMDHAGDMHTQMGASFLLKGFKVLFFIFFLFIYL